MTKSLYIKNNFTCKLQVIQYQKKKKKQNILSNSWKRKWQQTFEKLLLFIYSLSANQATYEVSFSY